MVATVMHPADEPAWFAAAKEIFALGFSPANKSAPALAAKAREGTLTSDEHAEIEAYGHVRSLLGILKSRARRPSDATRVTASLGRSQPENERIGEHGASGRERVGSRASRDVENRSVDLILVLLIGLAAGWLAGQLVKRRGSGWVEDLIIGVIGALIGGFVFGLLGVNVGGLVGRLISATVGAVILLFLLRYIRRV